MLYICGVLVLGLVIYRLGTEVFFLKLIMAPRLIGPRLRSRAFYPPLTAARMKLRRGAVRYRNPGRRRAVASHAAAVGRQRIIRRALTGQLRFRRQVRPRRVVRRRRRAVLSNSVSRMHN